MEQRIFYTSDTHLHHKNIVQMENRPYKDSEEMTKELIYSWNQQVGDNDIVRHLGDITLTSKTKTIQVLEQLKGKLELVLGNHDVSKTWDRIIVERPDLYYKVYSLGFKERWDKDHMLFSHYPMEIGYRPNMWSIHGHIHGEESTYLNQINVGVDSPHFKHKPFGTLLTQQDIQLVMEERRESIMKHYSLKNL